MTCKIEGCDGAIRSKGLCEKHYARVRRNGTARAVKPRGTLEERLWASINKGQPDECWNWKRSPSAYGYGQLSSGAENGHKLVYAHRAVWELENGPIPPGVGFHGSVIMHTCDNRACCNPAHLVLGTQAENVADMESKGRRTNRPMPGESNPRAKLTDDIVRRLRAGEITPQQVALVIGCSPEAAQMAKAGTTWKHVKSTS